ncbi:hypothetical protein B0A50_07196 [Salinomyces thailandicus]|uniref:F-box domain-containing protein n=1 Tax=Salinomyces thailandicus TaxID=706561 RepID=A0A4U0TMZ9_9PEZI|nr:hypothetical protein B0A50_07196 [Salinomyces thailandica]
MTEACHLFRLPPELRIKIYELVLTFASPIKLRQTVSGSANTNILRTSKQLFRETLPVLYDTNTIAVTLNDFCERTDSSLQSPVPTQHVRHLLMTSFGESIACNFLLDRCPVCEITGEGLLEKFRAMPRLKDVVVDYSSHVGRFTRFKQCWFASPRGAGAAGGKLMCTGVGIYEFDLGDAGSQDVRIAFQNAPLSKIWPQLMESLEDEEAETLARLRKVDADWPDKLWLLVCTRRYGLLEQYCADVARQWSELDGIEADGGGREALSVALDGLTHVVQAFPRTAPQSRRLLQDVLMNVKL